MSNEKVDVVIVGAGASGSVYASVLAKAGKKVVLLESGPDWELSDLISSEIWGRRIKPAGAPILLEGKNPMAYAAQGGWGVGGAALHYFANFPRLLPTDFRVKSEHNRAHDWPIAYEDVAPFYDKVARDTGVSGDAMADQLARVDNLVEAFCVDRARGERGFLQAQIVIVGRMRDRRGLVITDDRAQRGHEHQ